MTQLYIGVYILFYILFHYSLFHDIKCSSLCYTIESCCSSILHFHLLDGQKVCSVFSIRCYGKTRMNFLASPLLTPNSQSKKYGMLHKFGCHPCLGNADILSIIPILVYRLTKLAWLLPIFFLSLRKYWLSQVLQKGFWELNIPFHLSSLTSQKLSFTSKSKLNAFYVGYIPLLSKACISHLHIFWQELLERFKRD